jgi:hypothetical protein
MHSCAGLRAAESNAFTCMLRMTFREKKEGSKKASEYITQTLQIQVLTLGFDNALLRLPVHRVDVLRAGVVQQQR